MYEYKGGGFMKQLFGILSCILILSFSTIAFSQEQNMMNPGQGERYQMSQEGIQGGNIFFNNCVRCHPQGGNIIDPDLPIRGSKKLKDFNSFLNFIRNPKRPDGSRGVMPAFPESNISDQQAKELYQYITSPQSSEMISGGHGIGTGMMGYRQGWNYCPYCGGYIGNQRGYGMGYGMMGGGMMHQGMMGGYGMGQGMMGPGKYDYSEECQKFFDDTVKERKELYNKRYEYSEAFRDPKTSPEDIAKLEKEIRGLQEELYKKAQKVPQGCWY
jgi:cytochrome c553